jgi:hypothetical protein
MDATAIPLELLPRRCPGGRKKKTAISETVVEVCGFAVGEPVRGHFFSGTNLVHNRKTNGKLFKINELLWWPGTESNGITRFCFPVCSQASG